MSNFRHTLVKNLTKLCRRKNWQVIIVLNSWQKKFNVGKICIKLTIGIKGTQKGTWIWYFFYFITQNFLLFSIFPFPKVKLLIKTVENVKQQSVMYKKYTRKNFDKFFQMLSNTNKLTKNTTKVVTEPFIFKKEKHKIVFDSLDALDIFRQETNLKGKKIPNLKKNEDAQFFQNYSEACSFLDQTRQYFDIFFQSVKIDRFEYEPLKIAKEELVPLNRNIFLLPCRSFLIEPVDEKYFNNLDYYDIVYRQIRTKKKTYKTSCRFVCSYSGEDIIISDTSTILWFYSNIVTISN